jgi:hypothetical protein
MCRQYTVAEDTLGRSLTYYKHDMTLIIQIDPDDLIFPRTATRQGPKFQAVVPPAPDRDAVLAPGECHQLIDFKSLTWRPDPDERGGDNTVEVLGNINSLTEAEGTHLVFVGVTLPNYANFSSG